MQLLCLSHLRSEYVRWTFYKILRLLLLLWVKVCITAVGCDLQDEKVTGRKADVILAAHHAAEAALRLVKPGNEVCCWGLLLVFSHFLDDLTFCRFLLHD